MNQGNWLMLDLDNQKIFKSPDGQTDESEMDIRSRFCCIDRRITAFMGIIKFPANGIAVTMQKFARRIYVFCL